MEIDCDRCEMRGAGCQDCVITMLQPRNVAGFPGADPGYLAELTEAEVKALDVLAAAGLVSPLRLALPGASRPGPALLPGPRPWGQRAFPETKASLCFRDRIRHGA